LENFILFEMILKKKYNKDIQMSSSFFFLDVTLKR